MLFIFHLAFFKINQQTRMNLLPPGQENENVRVNILYSTCGYYDNYYCVVRVHTVRRTYVPVGGAQGGSYWRYVLTEQRRITPYNPVPVPYRTVLITYVQYPTKFQTPPRAQNLPVSSCALARSYTYVRRRFQIRRAFAHQTIQHHVSSRIPIAMHSSLVIVRYRTLPVAVLPHHL